jgi:hypothetical protein
MNNSDFKSLFLDTEFTQIFSPNLEPKLISIGLINEEGDKTFYAELTDHYIVEECSDFVREIVLPLLDAPDLPAKIDYNAIYARMSFDDCRVHLTHWIELIGEPALCLSDAPNFDWPFVQDLFYDHPWPGYLLKKPQNCVPFQWEAQFKYHKAATIAQQSREFRRHHALDDAKVMRLASLASKS